MCSRYHLSRKHLLAALDRLGIPAPATAYATRYNIAPSTTVPAVRRLPRGARAELTELRWGLTPGWAQADEPAARLVNARAETLAAKPSFRDALALRRCLVPASGFYEWEVAGRVRHPWYFRRQDDEPALFAGLWEIWRAPSGETVESCAIITTAPNAVMRPIHHRMPALLTPEQCAIWLDPRVSDPAALGPLLQPAPDDAVAALAVSPHVSSVQNEGPECLAPDPARRGGPAQLSLGFE